MLFSPPKVKVLKVQFQDLDFQMLISVYFLQNLKMQHYSTYIIIFNMIHFICCTEKKYCILRKFFTMMSQSYVKQKFILLAT